MLTHIVAFFSQRHLLTNLLFFGTMLLGVVFWFRTSKEEMPNISFDRVAITTTYPGASPEEVEHFLTRPIEERLQTLDGIHRVTSTSSDNTSSIRVELEPGNPDRESLIADIKSAVLDVPLPDEVLDEPRVRVFKTSMMAIVDVGLYREDLHLLDDQARRELQAVSLALEKQLLARPQLVDVGRSGYLQEELQIKADPESLRTYNIPFSQLAREIKAGHVRRPAGSLKDKREAKVSLVDELDRPEKLADAIVQAGFEGQTVKVRDLARVEYGFEETRSIHKINGREGIMLNVTKSSAYGILEATDEVGRVVDRFRRTSLKHSPIRAVLLDDESRDVRNRLAIVGSNGLLGFALILISLVLFLDFRSSVWVATGIPFSLAATMVAAHFMGYTINNITLAAVIIVMGMVVDDAIVVAENITRLRSQGVPTAQAVVSGTTYVFLPVTAAILTTCAAFIPIMLFEGRFGRMMAFIPPVIFIMLFSSLVESLLILPSHMALHVPRWLRLALTLGTLPLFERWFGKKSSDQGPRQHAHWFYKVEDAYGRLLGRILRYKILVVAVFVTLLALSGWLAMKTMKFVMFPDEETTQINVMAAGPEHLDRFETAALARKVEDVIQPYIGKEVIGFRTGVAQSRRGGGVEENKFRMRVEIKPADKRKKSADQLIKEWESGLDKSGFAEIKFSKSHWSHDSGSPIELLIQENRDDLRTRLAETLAERMKQHPGLANVEIERPPQQPEFQLSLKRSVVKQLGVAADQIGATLRGLLEGTVLYELLDGDEEMRVRLSVEDGIKRSLPAVLRSPVENEGRYLVPLQEVVTVRETMKPNAVTHEDYKRTMTVFADIDPQSKLTALEVAAHFEEEVFPALQSQYPSAILSFKGEVEDTRESGRELTTGIVLAVLLIYAILALLFNSLFKPLLILATIPFGLVGIVLAFAGHGITQFSFTAAIGALGLAGVVVNDAIVMLTKLDKEYDRRRHKELSNQQVAEIAKTRLRAVMLTTLTTVAGLFPTAYGVAGYDALLAQMMLALGWGLIFGTLITLLLVPSLYGLMRDLRHAIGGRA